MTRGDCISNRNIRIVSTYVSHKLGSYHGLFDGLSYRSDEYSTPEDFFLNEDEWTTQENFEKIFRRARKLVNEPNFYFNCGASSGRLGSWGRLHYFVKVFASPTDGYKRIPFFNRNFNDTKEIEVIQPPAYDRRSRKVRTLLKVESNADIDPHKDYIRDPYLRGILSSIPTIWGIDPAEVRQILNPYNPEVLFNEEPEFVPYNLEVKITGDQITLRDPIDGKRRVVGETIILKPEIIAGREVFLGKYRRLAEPPLSGSFEGKEAFLITKDIRIDEHVLLEMGEIFLAPYFMLDISYDQLSFRRRFSQVFRIGNDGKGRSQDLTETINQLRKSMEAKSRAYQILEKTNAELSKAKASLDEYSQGLERKVEERTAELRLAQDELLQLNSELESKVKKQIIELERYNELRRYLSPKLTEKILSAGDAFGDEPTRKMMTVVFTDIRGFSRVTDSIEPEELFHVLDGYLSAMIDIIHHHDGTLNKVIGDGLLIFFGDPIAVEDHAERAVRMAIDMQRMVRDLGSEWTQYGYDLGIGIGINTGYMTVGNIGPDTHKDYTVIGNQVNVAARLESMAGAGQTLISQRTYSKVKHFVDVRPVGDIDVKGIHQPVKTYDVIW
ncbi:MAG: adenylate/guanylate cyclase domain-containing protein [Thermodesulfobacteriota bacterium]|nr:adenylate/guanylate cyclase domain-containing protein [Thermodesulfobacteriota bacterium]